jgi:hypothetical protein
MEFRDAVTVQGTGAEAPPDSDVQSSETYVGYELIRQKGAVDDRTFEIEFLDAGAQVFAFTFG